MRKRVFLFLVIMWMTVIFCFSNRDGNESSADSSKVGRFLCEVFVKDYDSLDTISQKEKIRDIDMIVRKTAHAVEYAILSILILGAVCDETLKLKNSLLAWMGATVYAVTDEFHQLFVPGRAGRVLDVLIDSTGAIVGIILVNIIFACISIHRSKKTKGNVWKSEELC